MPVRRKKKTHRRKLTAKACSPLRTMRLPHGYELAVRKRKKKEEIK